MRNASTRLPEQGTQTPSPAPDLIPAEAKHQPRTHIRIGTANGGTSYTTLLTQNNEDVKVVQELLRHANSRITLDLYAQAGMPEKRQAQSMLVERVLQKGKAAV